MNQRRHEQSNRAGVISGTLYSMIVNFSSTFRLFQTTATRIKSSYLCNFGDALHCDSDSSRRFRLFRTTAARIKPSCRCNFRTVYIVILILLGNDSFVVPNDRSPIRNRPRNKAGSLLWQTYISSLLIRTVIDRLTSSSHLR